MFFFARRQQLVEKMKSGAFEFRAEAKPPKGSVLYEEHLKLTPGAPGHIAEFAGFLMPLWYSSIAAEHEAVRRRAGLFDCTHMGAIEVSGKNAEAFLDAITTNNVRSLQSGHAQYSYILDAAGNVLDDIIVYRRGDDPCLRPAGAGKFMVVVNAANEPKIKAYLAALKKGQASMEDRRIEIAAVRDMKDTNGGSDCKVDIALQGPESVAVLSKLDKSAGQRAAELRSFTFFEGKISGLDCIISRTGYTGAKVCFELFVHPETAAKLWQQLLSAGAIPCGLGARDSLRVEAGLPLYGHELDGPHNISPFEAGYGWAVKLEKEFFIGKAAIAKLANNYNMKVARIELLGEKGVRPIRQNDAVISKGQCIGWVLSSATAGNRQIGLVYVEKDQAEEGDSIGVYYLARSGSQKSKGKKEKVEKGQRVEAEIVGKVLSRFEKF
jgi:glycine hydroxymethyltransferase